MDFFPLLFLVTHYYIALGRLIHNSSGSEYHGNNCRRNFFHFFSSVTHPWIRRTSNKQSPTWIGKENPFHKGSSCPKMGILTSFGWYPCRTRLPFFPPVFTWQSQVQNPSRILWLPTGSVLRTALTFVLSKVPQLLLFVWWPLIFRLWNR